MHLLSFRLGSRNHSAWLSPPRRPSTIPGRTLKIYLLLIDHARFFFYSDESQASHDSPMTSTIRRNRRDRGVQVGFMPDTRAFKSAWQHADSGALLWMRRVWDWLHTWAHPDEAMLARLWSARRIDLHHPAARRRCESVRPGGLPRDAVEATSGVADRQRGDRALLVPLCDLAGP